MTLWACHFDILSPRVQIVTLDPAAVQKATEAARNAADNLTGADKAKAMKLANEIDALSDQLADLERRGLVRSTGDSLRSQTS